MKDSLSVRAAKKPARQPLSWRRFVAGIVSVTMLLTGLTLVVGGAPVANAAPLEAPMVFKFLASQSRADLYRDELRLDLVLRVPTGSVNYQAPTQGLDYSLAGTGSFNATNLHVQYDYDANGTLDRSMSYKNTFTGSAAGIDGATAWARNIDEYYTIHSVITSGPYDYLVMSFEGDLNLPDGDTTANVPGGAPRNVAMAFTLRDPATGTVSQAGTYNMDLLAYYGNSGNNNVTGPLLQMMWDDVWQLGVTGQSNWGAVLDYGFRTTRPATLTTPPGLFPQNFVGVPLQNAQFNNATSGPKCSVTDSFWYAWVYEDGSLVTSINTAPVHVTGMTPVNNGNNATSPSTATYNSTLRGTPRPGMTNNGQPELNGPDGGAMKSDGSIDFDQVRQAGSPSDTGFYRLAVWPESHDPLNPTSTATPGPCIAYADASDLVDPATGLMTPEAEEAQSTAATAFYKYEIPRPGEVTIETPTDGSTIAGQIPQLTGTGTPGNTVTLKDVTDPDNPVTLVDGYTSDGEIVVGADGIWSWTSPTPLDDGQYTWQAEQTEHTDGYELTSVPVTVTFSVDTVPDALQSSLELTPAADPDDPAAGAVAPVNSPITATVTVRNKEGMVLPNQQVTFQNAHPDQVKLTDPVTGAPTTSCTTGADGAGCSVEVTSSAAGSYPDEISATILVNGQPQPVNGSPGTVAFTVGTVDAGQSSLVLDPAYPQSVPVDGDGVQATVTAKDSFGNPVVGASVAFTVDGGATFGARHSGEQEASCTTQPADAAHGANLSGNLLRAVRAAQIVYRNVRAAFSQRSGHHAAKLSRRARHKGNLARQVNRHADSLLLFL